MKNENRHDIQNEAPALLRAVRQIEMEPSPFLKTRVLARLHERQSQVRGVRLWQRIAAGLVVGLGVLAFIYFPTHPSGFQAEVNSNLLVKVDVETVSADQVVYVAVELAEGVEFFSGGHSEIAKERRLVFPFRPEMSKGQFPFVVKGLEKGLRRVKVTFLDEQERPLGEKVITIDFKDSKGSLI